jgi:hypothetical protein
MAAEASPEPIAERPWRRSFWSLIATQFLSAFIDNAYKNLVVFLFLALGLAQAQRDRLVPLVAFRFAIPYIPFSGLRQIFQALVALPPPPGMIGHYPGFPSLLVPYGVANDFFFSGHTAVAVLGAVELGRLGRPWLRMVGIALAIFEVTVVLALRAHYTMDVFTGAVAALYIAQVAERIAPPATGRWRGFFREVPSGSYSYRSASMGSRLAALRAG